MPKTSISFTQADRKRITWLRKHFGGVGQGAVITMALKALQAQCRPSQTKAAPPTLEQARIAAQCLDILDGRGAWPDSTEQETKK